MRSNKELLEVVLANQNLFQTGLCNWVDHLFYQDHITIYELWYLEDFLDLKLPGVMRDGYCWPQGQIKVRLEFLEKELPNFERQ